MQMQQQPTQSAPAPGLTDSTADIEEGDFVIPPSLRDEPVFFVFSFRNRDGKRAKVPCDAGSVRARSVNSYEPPTTVTFAEAYELVKESRQRYSGRDQLDGIMLSLAESGLMCLDLDDVVQPDTGRADELATNLVGDVSSYTEISSSSTGLHIFLDEHKGLDPDFKTVDKIEFYDERGIAVTFRHVADTPAEIAETSGLTRALQREHNERTAGSASGSSDESETDFGDVDVDATGDLSAKQQRLVDAMLKWADDKVVELWEEPGAWRCQMFYDTDQQDYDRSDADHYLARSIAFWADESRVLADVEFSDSELSSVFMRAELANRSKCQQRTDYVPRTIASARNSGFED